MRITGVSPGWRLPRWGRVWHVCMYIYVYVINIYVYMYIRVCTKPTRVHRSSANPVSEEEVPCWTPQPSSPFVPALPAPSVCPSVAARVRSRLGVGRRWGSGAFCRVPGQIPGAARGAGKAAKAPAKLRVYSGLPHVPCACGSADVPTPGLCREAPVWSAQYF